MAAVRHVDLTFDAPLGHGMERKMVVLMGFNGIYQDI